MMRKARKIAALFAKAVFHNGRVVEDDSLQDEDLYVDMGDDPLE